jgi:HSP20 family protein
MEVRMTNETAPNGLPFGRWTSLFDELGSLAPRELAPRADVVEHADGYHFYFEMGGLSPESIEARVEDGALVVEAERQRPQWPKDSRVRVAERTFGKLHRAFELPEDAAHDGIAATYKDGVLEVTVPKRPESKPYKIKVSFEN